MKITPGFSLAIFLVAGCAPTCYETDNNARLKLTAQMAPAWLNSHIAPGRTTQPEVHQLFGNPLFKNLSTGSSLDTNSIPLEMWTYQGGWDKKVKQPRKFIVFSFTNDIVSGYQVSQNIY